MATYTAIANYGTGTIMIHREGCKHTLRQVDTVAWGHTSATTALTEAKLIVDPDSEYSWKYKTAPCAK